MGAPFGNQNGIGNKGGGRKSAYQEMADAKTLHDLFFKPENKAKLKKLLDSGTYSLKDMIQFKAFGGDTRILSEIFRKIFPDSINMQVNPGNPLRALTDDEIDAKITELRKQDSGTPASGGEESEKG